MTRIRTALIAAAALLLFAAAPVSAITYGQPDANEHPYVGFMIFFDASEPGWYSCSGTLLSPTVFLTAGHCTIDIGSGGADIGPSGGTDVWVTFAETDVLAGWPARAAYSDEAALYTARAAWLNSNGYVRGVSHPNPLYANFAQFPVNYDDGVVVLGSGGVTLTQYGVLAPIGTADVLAKVAKNRNLALIETVGYGIQAIQPNPMDVASRYKSTSRIVEVNGHASKGGNLHTLNNPSPIGGTGGSCFGDSGGPLFVNNTNQVVAVVSYGDSLTCHGADYSWRVDNQEAHDFVGSFLTD